MTSFSSSSSKEWKSEDYQKSLAFVPKLAAKILEWLDPQPDDHILDLGCGDGVLDVHIAHTLAQGEGKLLGLDISLSMIQAARKNVERHEGLEDKCQFMPTDTSSFFNSLSVVHQPQHYTKVFSSAAVHWMLGELYVDDPTSQRMGFFQGVKSVLKPGGTFVFEMGGLGNISEARAAMVNAVARKLKQEPEEIKEPWFFPDEEWVRTMLEVKVGGFKIERSEIEWRPTKLDGEGGLDGWVRLVGSELFRLITNETEREEARQEVVRLLKIICRREPANEGEEVGYVMNYVRLRIIARKLEETSGVKMEA